ncbi:hydroxymethylbilane synthase [Quadrisphaera granulorum]|uniref:Porphobilinogen deaminase n=1 Tax=Quadrisphaera granulorum TaxID=317664 RepID=A0A316A717_9ACTN|nr:hydroxymethylbilane synthase [Quadrisphaera granulorum]PWJ53262.1 hydroxymethylbilane synthase [Quadrisphaera granulorum]SZE96936.1 hydroxymethylbilane synthase [Quadrisphaera granulorum]
MSGALDSAVGGAVLRLGTRRSALARTQSEHVAQALRERTGRAVELVEVTTEGDVSRAPLSSLGGTGVFATALRDALLAGRVDLAVHSLKDLPTAPADGLVVAAVPPREDPRDVLVASGGRSLDGLPAGARVGTGSPRRAAQLRALRPDLEVVDVRGNVDTRLRFVADGQLDAVVLARAGLLRLGRADEATDVLDTDRLLPAPGQGALAVECRSDDADVRAVCALLDDASSRAATIAERALLAALEAGCAAPVGALAVTDADGELRLTGLVAALDGSATVVRTGSGPREQAADLGRRVAEQLLASGSPALAPLAPSSSSTSSADPVHPETPRTSSAAPQPASNAHDTAATAPPERVHL